MIEVLMCGRYVIYDQLTKGSLSLLGHEITPDFNVAPTTNVPIIRPNYKTKEQELRIVRWGLIPNWAKNLKIPPFFNARADKLPGNKVFWPSINQRCLIPMAGFYEWAEQDKQPYYIYSPQEPFFCTAGIWNQWQLADGQTIESCAIITTKPNETLADIHHRMPVILDEDNYEFWLYEPFEKVKKLLQPFAGEMAKYALNPKTVNNARNNSLHNLDRLKPNKNISI